MPARPSMRHATVYHDNVLAQMTVCPGSCCRFLGEFQTGICCSPKWATAVWCLRGQSRPQSMSPGCHLKLGRQRANVYYRTTRHEAQSSWRPCEFCQHHGLRTRKEYHIFGPVLFDGVMKSVPSEHAKVPAQVAPWASVCFELQSSLELFLVFLSVPYG